MLQGRETCRRVVGRHGRPNHVIFVTRGRALVVTHNLLIVLPYVSFKIRVRRQQVLGVGRIRVATTGIGRIATLTNAGILLGQGLGVIVAGVVNIIISIMVILLGIVGQGR